MALQYGVYAIQQGTGANLPHILDFNTARSTDNDPVFSIRNGGTEKFGVVYDSATGLFRLQVGLVSPKVMERTAVRGVIGTQLAVPDSTQTVIPFDGTEDFDSHGFHDSSSNPSRFTIPAGMGGLYLPFLNVETPVASATRVLHKVLVNGSGGGEAVKAQPGYHHGTTSFLFGCMFPPLVLAAADYVQFTVYQESGSSVNIAAGGFNCAGLILLSK
jgi:hypothetical protein